MLSRTTLFTIDSADSTENELLRLVAPRIDYSLLVDQCVVLHGSADRLQSMCGPVCPYCMGPRIDYSLYVDQCVLIAWVRG